MSTPHEDFPEDEFDVAGRDRTPQGVHRGPRSPLRTLLPILAVVVLAPLLAWGAIALLGDGGEPAPTAGAPAATATAAPGGEATGPAASGEAPAEGTEGPSEGATSEEPTEETTTEEPGGEIQYGAPIAVLNGAGINGLAADVVGTLSGAGFTGGVADDYTSAAPATTTLYYNNPDLQATAEEVAKTLNIGNVVESSSATQSIAIVLRSDYQG